MSSSDINGALAERLLKLAIALVLLVMILGPVLALSMHLGGLRIADFISRQILGAFYKGSDSHGITAGPDIYALEDLEAKLMRFTAYRGEAKGAAQALQIVLVRHTRSQTQAAFNPLKLNLAGAKDTATVLITDRPVLIELDHGAPARRAMLGVEGVAPFDLKAAPPGILSGFRIGAFGANRVARPEQLVDGHDAPVFCGAIKNWRTFYGLGQGSVQVTVATNPTAVTVTDQGVSSDGEAPVDVPALGRFCGSY
jgi:hypothetical protein